MTELPERWITDTEISPRFPYYTRANADEVGPEPFSPLGWSLGWGRGCVPGVADGFVSFGVVTLDEFALDPPEVFGNWGGYFYNQLSLPRVMGVRMPGATPEAIDQAYFGDHPGVPPYTPHPDDDNADQAAKLEQTMGWVMSTDGHPAMEEWKANAIALRSARPDLSSMSDAELVARARSVLADVHQAWVPYCEICLGASLGPGAVQMVCGAIGRPEAAVQPGDIMIAPTTDPSWTPLFLQAGAVVCNVGAIASHAAIVSRELGVPCVVSVIDATDRIPEGATVTVDGAAGTVTIG